VLDGRTDPPAQTPQLGHLRNDCQLAQVPHMLHSRTGPSLFGLCDGTAEEVLSPTCLREGAGQGHSMPGCACQPFPYSGSKLNKDSLNPSLPHLSAFPPQNMGPRPRIDSESARAQPQRGSTQSEDPVRIPQGANESSQPAQRRRRRCTQKRENRAAAEEMQAARLWAVT
jgi:hypothetical protein